MKNYSAVEVIDIYIYISKDHPPVMDTERLLKLLPDHPLHHQ